MSKINYFLVKTDPESYSLEDFKKEKITKWDGVHNYQAINFLKQMKSKDLVFIYYSQIKQPKIVALSEVEEEAVKDNNDKRGISWYPKIKLLKIFEDNKQLSLEKIKSQNKFPNLPLIKQSRLSVMPLDTNFIKEYYPEYLYTYNV